MKVGTSDLEGTKEKDKKKEVRNEKKRKI